MLQKLANFGKLFQLSLIFASFLFYFIAAFILFSPLVKLADWAIYFTFSNFFF